MERFIDDLTVLRLVVEGAITLYERDNNAADPDTYNLIGEALYLMREHVCVCLKAYQQEEGKP
ncbi:MAG: hypothetical protein IJU50_00400 [Lachnospiraceae bacterium]|nr:hypothetical protein [Lachnospiraceae bacterium]